MFKIIFSSFISIDGIQIKEFYVHTVYQYIKMTLEAHRDMSKPVFTICLFLKTIIINFKLQG